MSHVPSRSPGAQLAALVRLSLPIAAAQAGFASMALVDTAVVGRLGAGPLAAIGLANGVFLAVGVVGLGVMMGLDPLVAQAFGAGDKARAHELLWQGGWLALLASAALAVPILLMPPVLLRAGLHEPTVREAIRCLLARLPGLLPMLLFAGLRSFLQAAGRVLPLVVAMALANVANLVFDLLFVFGGSGLPAWTGPLRAVPALGAMGSALVTAFCSGLQFAVLLWAVQGLVRDSPVRRRPNKADLMAAARLGLPVGLQMGAEVGVFALVGLLAGRFGDEAMAAHQLAISLASLTFCFAVGVGNAGSVLVGWAVGARDTPAARRAGLLAFVVGAGLMAVGGLLFWLWPAPIARLISSAPEVVAASVPLLAVAAVFQISDGVQAVGAGVLRGTGDTRFAFAANVAGHWLLGLPLAIGLGFGLGQGVVGLWWGLCAGLTAVAASLFARFWHRSATHIEPLEARRLTPQGEQA
jgi:MATE family multidrug resistance protein